jgi:hypothetical protein
MKGDIMNPRRDGIELPGTNAPVHAARTNRPLKLAGGIALIALLLFVSAHWPQADLNAARPGPPENDVSTEQVSVIDYFPAQFGNPAKGQPAEEHIQAF